MGEPGFLYTFWQSPKAAMTFQSEEESGAHEPAPAPFLSLSFLCLYFLRSFLIWSSWFYPWAHAFLMWELDPEKTVVNPFSSPAAGIPAAGVLGISCCAGKLCCWWGWRSRINSFWMGRGVRKSLQIKVEVRIDGRCEGEAVLRMQLGDLGSFEVMRPWAGWEQGNTGHYGWHGGD